MFHNSDRNKFESKLSYNIFTRLKQSELAALLSIRHGIHQWNKLLEICCVKYKIFVWCNKSIYFNGTAHTMKQETYVSWNLFINCASCYIFHWFKWKEYNKLLKICFPNVHWAASMLHAICFIGLRHALKLRWKNWRDTKFEVILGVLCKLIIDFS